MAAYIGVSVGLGVVAFIASALGTRGVLAWLTKKAVLDIPNDRSSHSAPTPRGGGLAVSMVVFCGWAAAVFFARPDGVGSGVPIWPALLAAACLYLLSWIDDRISLSRRLRFLLHGVAVAGVLALFPSEITVFAPMTEALGWGGDVVPLWVDRGVTGLAWLWFVNLYNFMDGIDGITGVETASIGGGIILLVALGSSPSLLPLAPMAAVLVGAACGFLPFNWYPARVFLGDVGSIPLGYLIGFLLITLAASGSLAAAVILPAVYLWDATATLLIRLVSGKSIAVAHREHFYQRAVHEAGLSHAQVSGRLALANVGLCLAALLAEHFSPVLALGSGAVVLGFLLVSWRVKR